MGPILRVWVSLALAAAGLIHLSLALDSPAPLGAVLGIIGLAEFGLATVTVAIGRLVAPPVALVAALAPAGVWILAVLVIRDPQVSRSLLFVPLGLATLLEFLVASAIGVELRRRGNGSPAAPPPSTRRFLVAVTVGALVIAGITAPALAASQQARVVSPDGTFVDDHELH